MEYILRAKPHPVLYTIYDKEANIVKLKHKLRMDETGNLTITNYPSKEVITYYMTQKVKIQKFICNGSNLFHKYLDSYV